MNGIDFTEKETKLLLELHEMLKSKGLYFETFALSDKKLIHTVDYNFIKALENQGVLNGQFIVINGKIYKVETDENDNQTINLIGSIDLEAVISRIG